MNERRILLRPFEVIAVIDGRKTQRRDPVHKTGAIAVDVALSGSDGVDLEKLALECPYGAVGDRLWVGETWAFEVNAMGAKREEDGPFVYGADAAFGRMRGTRLCERWRGAVTMPRWASRITLEITGVRAQRLQDISLSELDAEGFGHGRANYRWHWEDIHGEGSWSKNPFVWVREFKVVSK